MEQTTLADNVTDVETDTRLFITDVETDTRQIDFGTIYLFKSGIVNRSEIDMIPMRTFTESQGFRLKNTIRVKQFPIIPIIPITRHTSTCQRIRLKNKFPFLSFFFLFLYCSITYHQTMQPERFSS
jgi:hypothetical protein